MTSLCPVNSSLCTQSTTPASCDSEINAVYSGKTPGVLPSTPNGSTDRESNGMLKQSVVKGIVDSLLQTGVVPKAETSNADQYPIKVKELLENIKAEYCFYDSRYKYCLERALDSIRQGFSFPSNDVKQLTDKYLGFCQILTRRLNDLIQIINGITEQLLRSSDILQVEINGFNERIMKLRSQLEKQNQIIMSNEASTKLKKEMVKYTEEKGRYSDNLLQLYGFLNIVAVGLLIYVYKASSD
jgi:hypothetical protein